MINTSPCDKCSCQERFNTFQDQNFEILSVTFCFPLRTIQASAKTKNNSKLSYQDSNGWFSVQINIDGVLQFSKIFNFSLIKSSSCITRAILQTLVFLACQPFSCDVSDKQSDLQALPWLDLDAPQ